MGPKVHFPGVRRLFTVLNFTSTAATAPTSSDRLRGVVRWPSKAVVC